MPFIYKIFSPKTDKVYIGSTTTSLKTRFSHHKSISNKCRSRLIIDLGDAEITLLEECSKDEMINCEFKYFKIYDVVNLSNTVNYKTCDKKEYEKQRIRGSYVCKSCCIKVPIKNKLRHERTYKHISKFSNLE